MAENEETFIEIPCYSCGRPIVTVRDNFLEDCKRTGCEIKVDTSGNVLAAFCAKCVRFVGTYGCNL